jgi:hypothetical protein
MVPLSERTLKLVQRIFKEEFQSRIVDILENECADNLPFLENETSENLERFRFAVLKLGKTNISKLEDAIELAKEDWRDLLVAAKFANSVEAHRFWAKKKYGIG